MHAPQVRMLSLSVVWWHVGCVGCSEMMEMTLIIEQQQQQQQVTTPVSSQGITTTTSDVERSIVVVMLLVFSVVGVAGNVVVLVVFSRRGDHLASTVFIVVLAVVDFTTCLIVAPFTVFISTQQLPNSSPARTGFTSPIVRTRSSETVSWPVLKLRIHDSTGRTTRCIV